MNWTSQKTELTLGGLVLRLIWACLEVWNPCPLKSEDLNKRSRSSVYPYVWGDIFLLKMMVTLCGNYSISFPVELPVFFHCDDHFDWNTKYIVLQCIDFGVWCRCLVTPVELLRQQWVSTTWSRRIEHSPPTVKGPLPPSVVCSVRSCELGIKIQTSAFIVSFYSLDFVLLHRFF